MREESQQQQQRRGGGGGDAGDGVAFLDLEIKGKFL